MIIFTCFQTKQKFGTSQTPYIHGSRVRYFSRTGWFKHKPPNSFRCQMSTPFLRVIDPDILAHVLNVPLPSLQPLLFSREIRFFNIYLCLKETPHFRRKKKKIGERLGRGTLNTWAEFQGLTLKNGVDIWTLVRLSAKIKAWHRNYLVSVYISILGVKSGI